ncbi:TlpA disulfide reductase family protein [uncultured Eudoraea sp.]|uniref:TlpA disulfide reductase family protein n=1 Tax=uncultured Eudoraea sp. TaxID=1035614 RepID=UPI002616772A|nr:TlpA disulfide reductase family protein [uncultured Eudoraea sp.]
MKNYFFTALLLGILMACNTTPEGYNLKGTLTGELENGTQVFLKKNDGTNQLVEVDTTTIENGQYTFTGTSALPELHYLVINEVRGTIPVVLENGSIEVSAQIDSLAFAKMKGTLQNDLFADFLVESRSFAKRARSMTDEMRNARALQDSAAITSLRDEYFELQEIAKTFELKFAKEHPEALISALIIEKVLTTKALPENEVRELYDALSPNIKETVVGQRIKSTLDKLASTSIGVKAPNFSAPTPTGDELALNDVLGKVTIVDFWAAWCKPCRAENPNVVQVYNKYHDKGLNILGVSLDRRAEDWTKAIEDDGLVWNHVSNVKYFDEIAELYNVKAIPATFILDENGVIIAKDLRGPALENKISELLQ